MRKKSWTKCLGICTILLVTTNIAGAQCVPLAFPHFNKFPEPDSKDVPITTYISISFTRFSPPIVKLEVEPKIEISKITVEPAFPSTFLPPSPRFIFQPAELLLPETNYTVTITYGQDTAPLGMPEGYWCLTSNTSWQFTTGSTIEKGDVNKLELLITGIGSTVVVGWSGNITFTVRSGINPVEGATITLTGVSTGNGTTDSYGNFVININATSIGNISYVVNKTGFVDVIGTINVIDNLSYPYWKRPPLRGDVNGDGVVNIIDALLIAKHVVNKNNYFLYMGDIDNDGEATLVDALYIARCTVGLRKC